jgi:GTP-binding protein LepA
MQMVFSDFYPGNDRLSCSAAFERLRSHASFVHPATTRPGFGFHGFLPAAHEIIQERLERGDVDVVRAAPTVAMNTRPPTGDQADRLLAAADRSQLEEIREPMVKLEIITGVIHRRDHACRGAALQTRQTDYPGPSADDRIHRALAEIVYDFYDQLKGISHGYATMDYEFLGFEAADWSRSTSGQ